MSAETKHGHIVEALRAHGKKMDWGVLERYDGDPLKIWNNRRNIENVRNDLKEFRGIGPALSRMAVLIGITVFSEAGNHCRNLNLILRPLILARGGAARMGLNACSAHSGIHVLSQV